MEKDKVKHIAVMMDGNGRWAKARNRARTYGHIEGANKFKEMCLVVNELGIKCFTVYAFSTENWKRSDEEIGMIMKLLQEYFESCEKLAEKYNFKIRVIGNKRSLSEKLLDSILYIEDKTKNNNGMLIQIAINYGGRNEIVRAAQLAMKDCAKDGIDEMLFEKQFERYLDTYCASDPDLLIRTGGEKRLSNFLLWQLAYTELFFVEKYWPDFSEEDLLAILDEFYKRERRFGSVEEKIKNEK